MLKFFQTKHVKMFGKYLAGFIMGELNSSHMKKDAKFMEKAQKTLVKADRLVQKFKLENKLNFYQRSQLANSFLWSLRDEGCPEAYASQLTDWLVMQMQ
ncbi:hypothetical protein SAMN05444579_11824 [Delftia tsuruhatensis]|nr:hypothetical protein [Delftia sp.]SFB63944.1 hypothetical protein SAMN05444579_11824 [Delftia tsuruhatensis]